MGIKASTDSLGSQAKEFTRFFEAQLSAIGLSDEQLRAQEKVELEDSLEVVNDAIRSPESFGSLNLKVTAGVGLLITNVGGESHFRIGALPILLQKKRFIQERLRALSASDAVTDLREELAQEEDVKKRESLEEKIGRLEQEVGAWTARSEKVAQVDLAQALDAEAKKANIQAELFERRHKVWQQWLERESVATIVGALLVVIITVAFICTSFGDYELPEVLKNGYLVILGYFFGQGLKSRGRLKSPNEEGVMPNPAQSPREPAS